LFKHFPNKEALYSAMQLFSCGEHNQGRIQRLRALEPSASTLAVIVHFLFTRFVCGCTSRDDEQTIQGRLVLRSLADDGEFARLLLRQLGSGCVVKVEACVKAAVAAGEAVDGHVPANLGAWFAHHLAAMLMLHLLPADPAVDYGLSRDKLVEQA